jgi:hypothetical protein
MNLPIQSQPVMRQSMTANSVKEGIIPSDCCPNNGHCEGLCLFGQCLGVFR